MTQLDKLDLKLLAELQRDGRLTNNDLSERIALSPSQCSRRRARLEAEGFIRGYRADIDRQKMGLGLMVVISVTLATHNRDNAKRFAELLADLGSLFPDRGNGLSPEGRNQRPCRPFAFRKRGFAAARFRAACQNLDCAKRAQGL